MAPVINSGQLNTVTSPSESNSASLTWIFWVAFVLTLATASCAAYLFLIFFRRHRHPVDQSVQSSDAATSIFLPKQRLSTKVQSLYGNICVLTETTTSTEPREVKRGSRRESKVPINPSDSEIIRGLLVDGNPIPWVTYDPSGAPNFTIDTSHALGNISTDSDSEADITDIVGSYLTLSETTDKLLSPDLPNIRITLCPAHGKPNDVNFEKAPNSPVLVEHHPTVDYLQVPGTGRSPSFNPRLGGPVRFSFAGKYLISGAPSSNKGRSGKNGHNRTFAIVGHSRVEGLGLHSIMRERFVDKLLCSALRHRLHLRSQIWMLGFRERDYRREVGGWGGVYPGQQPYIATALRIYTGQGRRSNVEISVLGKKLGQVPDQYLYTRNVLSMSVPLELTTATRHHGSHPTDTASCNAWLVKEGVYRSNQAALSRVSLHAARLGDTNNNTAVERTT
ncbi:hypothetical protein BXZ70DRAFT_908298 [Cristinia sonorae]|uniref:Uncharacterized protein n=1 Tax=Cristinia sonorae TaxID=1940300 RepID=A0A8K0UKV4_9AGAR|nr:hypothetical protein BXZ70DRAFT_908298 [Cristinia sonorae]